ncbi:MAG: hypothetical protein U0670_16065 [Anaerolineae bacterium]
MPNVPPVKAEFDRQRRMLITQFTIFTVPLFVLSVRARSVDAIAARRMGNMAMEPPPCIQFSAVEMGFPFLFGLLATPVRFIVGRRYLVGAWKGLNFSANMDTLIARWDR